MAKLNRDRDTKTRAGVDFSLPVAAGVVIYPGAIVALTEAGLAIPADTIEAAGPLRFPCLAVAGADSREDDDVRVDVQRAVVGLDYDSTVTPAFLGCLVYLLDDHTVTADMADNYSPAGILVALEDGQAWVDLRYADV